MAVVLFKLGLRESDIFVDIGCGTGKISINAAPLVKWVYG
ncbi:MAG TPA: cobalt-precorrin-6Y C(15)-methyltransferase, partial [Methanolinea sp.]|nr:cobalt-precorrin-6Y C(15)-methyltransferase [Methanolinea sp.]